jgi:hypothetical protein
MRFSTLLLAGSALALVAFAPANAVVIGGLHNTGVDANNAAVTGVGSVDQHWSLADGTAYVSGQNGVFPLARHWIPDDTTSRWITPRPLAGTSLDPVVNGFYAYTLNFSLEGFLADTASFTGRFAADNSVSQIILNGNVLAASGGGFGSWKDFSANSGFVSGLNSLQFVVKNVHQSAGNPTGLRVEFTGSDVTAAAVPEPASWAMMIGGFGLVGAAMRRRERSVAA